MLTDCIRHVQVGADALFSHFIECILSQNATEMMKWCEGALVWLALPFQSIYPSDLKKKKQKKLADHRSCHHVPSHFFLQAGRHFISWLYSFWLGSSPHSSVIAMLKMAHPSRWGLTRAISRRAPQSRICLWAGTAQNRLFADVVFSAESFKSQNGKITTFLLMLQKSSAACMRNKNGDHYILFCEPTK